MQTETPLVSRSVEELRKALERAEVSDYAAEQLCRMLTVARDRNLSVKTLAKATRMSGGVISQMLNAAYPGNYDLRARLIERWLIDDEQRSIFGGRDDFVETRVALGLWRVFDKTRYSRRIQIVQSPEQLGKSRAAREYTARNNSCRTVMVTLQPGAGSNPAGIFLRDLAQACGLRDVRDRKIIDIRYQARDALAVCDLVILDEFHLVNDWPHRAVRDLLDYLRVELHADGARGVVLVATNSDVLTLLQKFRGKTGYNLGQLLGRMCNQPLELYPDEIPLEDVRALVERYYKPKKPTLDKLYDLATRHGLGHYGLLLDVLNRAWSECRVDRTDLTDDAVVKIADETLEQIAQKKELYR